MSTRVCRWSVGLAVFAAGATALAPGAIARESALLGPRGVEAAARRVASSWGERNPGLIEYASGTLERASAVIAASPATRGALNGSARQYSQTPVDLVLVEGHFVANAPGPRGLPAPKGRALELIIDARTGAAEYRALWPHHPPQPLSRLGRVIVLHGLGGSHHHG